MSHIGSQSRIVVEWRDGCKIPLRFKLTYTIQLYTCTHLGFDENWGGGGGACHPVISDCPFKIELKENYLASTSLNLPLN